VKKDALLTLLFLSLLAPISSLSLGAKGQAGNYVVSVMRTVDIYEGYVIVNDTFALQPISGLPEALMIGVPKFLSKNMISSYIYPYSVSSAGQRLVVEWPVASDGEFDWISVKIPASSGSFSFSVLQAYANLFSTTQYGEEVFTFPTVPALTIDVNSCYTVLRLDKWWRVYNPPSDYNETTVGESTILSHRYGAEPAKVNITEEFFVIPLREERYDVTNASRVIELNPFTGLTVTERFKVKALSYSTKQSISVFIFVNASGISVGDSIGTFLTESMSSTKRSMFKVSRPDNSSLTLVEIFPRYPMYPDQNYSFYISYHLLDENVTGISTVGRQLSLRLPVTTNFTSFAGNFTVEVLFPMGGKLEAVELGGYGLQNERSGTSPFSATIKGATKEVFDSPITLTYGYDTLWAGYAPSVALAFLFVAIFAYTLTRPKRPSEARAAPVELEALVRFVERYREKLRLEQSLERLQEDLRNNRITRQDFKARSRTQSQRLEDVMRVIPQLKAQVIKTSRGASDLITGIEVSEAQITSMSSAIRDLHTQFAQKKVSRAAYAKLLDNYVKKVKSERTRIGAALNELDSMSST
jgi:hypothetical protein